MKTYAKESAGLWHEVASRDGNKWRAVCGVTGQPYAGQPSSLTELASPPSPLCCGGPAGEEQQ